MLRSVGLQPSPSSPALGTSAEPSLPPRSSYPGQGPNKLSKQGQQGRSHQLSHSRGPRRLPEANLPQSAKSHHPPKPSSVTGNLLCRERSPLLHVRSSCLQPFCLRFDIFILSVHKDSAPEQSPTCRARSSRPCHMFVGDAIEPVPPSLLIFACHCMATRGNTSCFLDVFTGRQAHTGLVQGADQWPLVHWPCSPLLHACQLCRRA